MSLKNLKIMEKIAIVILVLVLCLALFLLRSGPMELLLLQVASTLAIAAGIVWLIRTMVPSPPNPEPLGFPNTVQWRGFWLRPLAYLIDMVPLVLLTVGLVFLAVATKSRFLLCVAYILLLTYKPLMESYYGATLGKMACGLKVVNKQGENLSLIAAYVRFLPFFAFLAIGFFENLGLFSTPEFKNASEYYELLFAWRKNQGDETLGIFRELLNWIIFFECLMAAFTHRQRALHDMIAGSFCVSRTRSSGKRRIQAESESQEFLRDLEGPEEHTS